MGSKHNTNTGSDVNTRSLQFIGVAQRLGIVDGIRQGNQLWCVHTHLPQTVQVGEVEQLREVVKYRRL